MAVACFSCLLLVGRAGRVLKPMARSREPAERGHHQNRQAVAAVPRVADAQCVGFGAFLSCAHFVGQGAVPSADRATPAQDDLKVKMDAVTEEDRRARQAISEKFQVSLGDMGKKLEEQIQLRIGQAEENEKLRENIRKLLEQLDLVEEHHKQEMAVKGLEGQLADAKLREAEARVEQMKDVLQKVEEKVRLLICRSVSVVVLWVCHVVLWNSACLVRFLGLLCCLLLSALFLGQPVSGFCLFSLSLSLLAARTVTVSHVLLVLATQLSPRVCDSLSLSTCYL